MNEKLDVFGNPRWKDILPAICIPLHDDYSVNGEELGRYVKWLSGFELIRGVVCNGHTGEVTSFNRAERKAITETVAIAVDGRIEVVSGVCAEGTLEAIDHALDAQDAGADAILLMPPHNWLRFGMKKESPVQLFRRVAEAIDISIIIHLYPVTTKAFYPVETLIQLAAVDHVEALKIGTRDMAVYERDIRILRRECPNLSILTCHDEYLLSSMYVGVDGALIGFAGCIPETICEAWECVKNDEFRRTRELQDQIFPMAEAVYGIGQPSGEAHARMKEALYQRGIFSSALMREPVLPLSDEEKRGVAEALHSTRIGTVQLINA